MATLTGKERIYVFQGGRKYELTPDDLRQWLAANGVATLTTAGMVLQSAAVANVATQTVTGADAASVAASATTAVNAIGSKVNALLVALRASGQVSST